ncbi:MAG: hypothetical protein PHH49_03225 [Candidatus Omnitrophica bacterium]|nr:hypothetical protein [Candidatus Omnitrophota bacterium]MDD5487962.1 hypothetical protein [Candidatus Omnitrophota bacterium]
MRIMLRYSSAQVVFLLLFMVVVTMAHSEISMEDGDMMLGVPLGGSGDGPDYDLCPQAVSVVTQFLNAWQRSDYQTMYELIDEESKVDYTFEDAKLDFQFVPFKPYTISSIRQSGDDFEFILTYGNWKSGDKALEKMILSGRTFKVKMPTRNSFFKKSLDAYF